MLSSLPPVPQSLDGQRILAALLLSYIWYPDSNTGEIAGFSLYSNIRIAISIHRGLGLG